MKTKYVFISIIMVIVLALPAYGQIASTVETNSVKKQSDIFKLMDRPVFKTTVDSLSITVWILSQKKYTELMKTNMGKTMGRMKDKNTKMDKSVSNAATAGTHYLIFDVTNIISGKEFADTSAKVEIVSPAKVIASVRLQPMMNHFGGGVSLAEKGDYLFTINLNIGMGYKTIQFKYKVK